MPADVTVTRLRRPELPESLPATANARLAAYRQERDDAEALLNGIGERLSDARLELANAQGALKALLDADESGHLVKQGEAGPLNRLGQRKMATQERDTARIEVAESRLRCAREELDTIIARQSALAARRSAFAAVVENCVAWAAQWAGPVTADERPAPKLRRGDNAAVKGIEHCRSQLQALHDQRVQVSRAPLPTDEARQRLRQRVLNLGDTVPAPNVNAVISSGLEAHQWPTRPLTVTTLTPTGEGEPTMGRGTARQVDVTAVIAALFPEQLIAFLEQSLPDDRGCLTDEQRFALVAELDAEIERVERDEATLLFQAMQAGADVLPRHEASAPAMLGVKT